MAAVQLDTETAKACARTIMQGMDYGSWSTDGLRITDNAAKALRQVGLSEIITVLPNSRLSASGKPLDLYARSIWHALCAALYQDFASRHILTTKAEALKDKENLLGRRLVFRGQPRPWPLQPSKWRHPDKDAGDRFVRAMVDCLRVYPPTPTPYVSAPEMSLNTRTLIAIAQHYEVPTNCIDLTFQPAVAAIFANGAAGAFDPPLEDPAADIMAGCGVIYAVNLPVLTNATDAWLEMPPFLAPRIYRQKAIFAHFGAQPDGPSEVPSNLDDIANHQWLERNCFRTFFPRTFPVSEDADGLQDSELMVGDPFLETLARQILDGTYSGMSNIAHKPQWLLPEANPDDPDTIIAHGKANAVRCRDIDAYLRAACLVTFRDGGATFDPVAWRFVEPFIRHEVDHLLEVAEITKHPALLWTAEQIRFAREHA